MTMPSQQPLVSLNGRPRSLIAAARHPCLEGSAINAFRRTFMGKLTVKTVKSGAFEVEVETTTTVLGVKELLHSVHNQDPPASQRLIYQGRVLTDALTLAEVGVRESDFLVLMVANKPAAAPAPPGRRRTPPTSAAHARRTMPAARPPLQGSGAPRSPGAPR